MFKQLFQVESMYDKSIKNNQQGVLLLLSLVMTSLILVAAIILATLAIREARLSAVSDRATTAYLASEGSAEEVLYEINVQSIADPLTLTGTSTLSNGVEVTRTVTQSSDTFVYNFIPAGGTVTVNLYDTAVVNQAANVSSLSIVSKSAGTIAYSINEWNGSTLTEIETGSFSGSGTLAALNPAMAYSVILAPSGQDAVDVVVTANNVVETPTTVLVVGELQGAQQAVELIIPKNPPWSGGAPPAPVCGNSLVEIGETCDDGNTTPGDGCSATCQTEAICGNGVREGGEACDDGNLVNGDGCSDTCTIEGPAPVCGNSLVEGAEICDDGDTTDANTCNLDCTALTSCGDGTVQDPNGEAVSEACDDGNTSNGDGCSFICEVEGPPGAVCGNNIIEAGEECDGTAYTIDGTYAPYASGVCSASCTYNSCITTTFSNATLGINASTPLFTWTYYVWNNPWPVVNGVTYSTLVPVTNITGVCVGNCTGFTSFSNPAYDNFGNNWRVSKIAEWAVPPVPTTPPLVRYNGTLQFCSP